MRMGEKFYSLFTYIFYNIFISHLAKKCNIKSMHDHGSLQDLFCDLDGVAASLGHFSSSCFQLKLSYIAPLFQKTKAEAASIRKHRLQNSCVISTVFYWSEQVTRPVQILEGTTKDSTF